MAEKRLVIQYEKTSTWFVFWAAIVFSVLLFCFYIGRYLSVNERESAIEQSKSLQKQLDVYQEAYQKANHDLVVQVQHAKVDSLSNKQLIETIKQLQQNQSKLRAELDFYRSIMAPELDQKGLTIAEFNTKKSQSEKRSKFKLVLTQNGKQDQFLKGSVKLVIEGSNVKTGLPVNYNFNDLGKFDPKHFQFKFRYFQNIEGEIQLPDDFIAKKVSISAKTKGLKKNQSAEKQLDWKV